MHTSPLKIFHVGLAKNACHLLPNDGNQLQFFMDVTTFVMQASRENIRIATKHGRVVFDQDTFNAIGIHWFKVGNVTNNLTNGPLARYGGLIKLILSHAGHGSFEQIRSLFVLFQQIVKCH